MKKSTPILPRIIVKVGDNTLEPLGVPDLHYRDQECPPKSRRFLRNIMFFDNINQAYISKVNDGIKLEQRIDCLKIDFKIYF